MRFIAANDHPDHDTIATFRRENAMAIKAAFVQVLLLARELGLLRLGMVSVGGTRLDADASKARSVRYDRAKELRAKLDADIAELLVRAETADTDASVDPKTLPAEIARRQALRRKLDEAGVRLEAKARANAEQERAGYEAKRRAPIGRGGAGRSPSPPDPTPPAERPSGTAQRNGPAERPSGTAQRNGPAERQSGTAKQSHRFGQPADAQVETARASSRR